jgi:hypothetical protein
MTKSSPARVVMGERNGRVDQAMGGEWRRRRPDLDRLSFSPFRRVRRRRCALWPESFWRRRRRRCLSCPRDRTPSGVRFFLLASRAAQDMFVQDLFACVRATVRLVKQTRSERACCVCVCGSTAMARGQEARGPAQSG